MKTEKIAVVSGGFPSSNGCESTTTKNGLATIQYYLFYNCGEFQFSEDYKYILPYKLYFGESPKIVEITSEDAELAKSLYDSKENLNKEYISMINEIERLYLYTTDINNSSNCEVHSTLTASTITANITPGGFVSFNTTISSNEKSKSDTSKQVVLYFKKGWNCGQFEFSDDFKFIIPSPEKPFTASASCLTMSNIGTTVVY